MAKFLYSNIDNQENIKDLFFRSSKEKNRIKKHLLREELIDVLTPFYDEIRRHGFYDIQLHFPNGVNFIRMEQSSKFGDNTSEKRATILESNRYRKYSSGLEKGRFTSAYRYVFPIFFNDKHIGSIDFSVSLQTITNSLESLFDGNYQIILKRSKNDVEDFNSDKTQWCQSENFYVIGFSNHDIEGIIEKCDQRLTVFQKINSLESFNESLVYNDQEFNAGFLSIANSNGDQSGFHRKLNSHS